MFDSKVLQGQTALITGGGTGLGLEMGKVFARHGAAIVICSRKAENLEAGRKALESHGATVMTLQVDIRDHRAVQKMSDAIIAETGRIDILVNNAAGNFVYPAQKLPLRAWKSVIDIVLNGTFFCSQIIGQEMLKAGRGNILNIVATYAWTGGPGTVHSASAKAGVLAMTRTLAVEWAHRGIRVNAIAPGPFDTQGASSRLWPTEAVETAVREQIPLKRFATTEEVAKAALYLVSQYGSYITGECLTIDGGSWLGKGIGNMADFLDNFEEIRAASKEKRLTK
ncbi:MAG TPA: SDR family oxidoreductase [Calditrichia bacterium]|nr:SDR family oxidoreductase [Calditrichia bacterium]HQV32560.1 SDR family oxidoreductase [Calditrichia bacterium]